MDIFLQSVLSNNEIRLLIKTADCGKTWDTWCEKTAYLELGIDKRGREYAINRCGKCSDAAQVPKKDWHLFKNREFIENRRCQECDAIGCEQCMPAPCRRCGSFQQIEQHHWMPEYLFELMSDKEKEDGRWPTDYLCRSCHMNWHRIVTPNMHKGR